jgi:phthalate 4,5-cis-dihydrodiol dehydrogenase
MGNGKNPDDYGAARRRLAGIESGEEEARLKAAGTYGGTAYKPSPGQDAVSPLRHQHFGPVIVSCERGDLRPMADRIVVNGNQARESHPLVLPGVPRAEVVDELFGALVHGVAPLHDGKWAKDTLQICIAMLQSSREQSDVTLDLARGRMSPR